MSDHRQSGPISFRDYERLSGVITATLQGTEYEAKTSCFFYALVGAYILDKKHGLEAKFRAGAAAYLVDETKGKGHVISYGNTLLSSETENFLDIEGDHFHCWIECEGFAIDLMAPLFPQVISEPIPRRMFQRPLSESCHNYLELKQPGDFHLVPYDDFGMKLLEMFEENQGGHSIVDICNSWYRPSPAQIETQIRVASSARETRTLRLPSYKLKGQW